MTDVQHIQHEELFALLQTDDRDKIDKVLEGYEAADMADFLTLANTEERLRFIEIVDSYHIPHILVELGVNVKTDLIASLGIKKSARLIALLDAEQAFEVIEDLEHDLQQEILSLMPKHLHEVLREVLLYPEESAGRLISKNMIVVPYYWTVKQALALIRTYKKISEKLHEIFVVDTEMKPLGSVSLTKLICNKHDVIIERIMDKDIKIITTQMDREEVAHMFRKYDLLCAAVVNTQERIIGVITVDGIMHVMQEEAEEDFMNLTSGLSSVDINASIGKTIKKRLPWLLITFMSSTLISFIVAAFSKTIQHVIALASLMPIITAISGNTSIQTATIAVVAITNKQLTSKNALRLLGKEAFVGFGNGLIIASIMMVFMVIRFNDWKLEILASLTLVIVVTLTTIIGASIPILLHQQGFNPSTSSSIIISAISDTISFTTLLGTATLLFL